MSDTIILPNILTNRKQNQPHRTLCTKRLKAQGFWLVCHLQHEGGDVW